MRADGRADLGPEITLAGGDPDRTVFAVAAAQRADGEGRISLPATAHQLWQLSDGLADAGVSALGVSFRGGDERSFSIASEQRWAGSFVELRPSEPQ